MLAIHVVFAALTFMTTNISLLYVSAEENAILNTTGVVILFVAQNTFLVGIHPPKGNITEYLGAVLIIIACLVQPMINIWSNTLKSKLLSKFGNSKSDIEHAGETTQLLNFQSR